MQCVQAVGHWPTNAQFARQLLSSAFDAFCTPCQVVRHDWMRKWHCVVHLWRRRWCSSPSFVGDLLPYISFPAEFCLSINFFSSLRSHCLFFVFGVFSFTPLFFFLVCCWSTFGLMCLLFLFPLPYRTRRSILMRNNFPLGFAHAFVCPSLFLCVVTFIWPSPTNRETQHLPSSVAALLNPRFLLPL